MLQCKKPSARLIAPRFALQQRNLCNPARRVMQKPDSGSIEFINTVNVLGGNLHMRQKPCGALS